MKNRIAKIALAVIIALTLGACSNFGLNISEMMHPPKATGAKAEIQALIDQEAGSDYTLKYPQSGNFRSAITMQDIDGDSKEEAVAFYLPSGEITTVHILILDTIGSQWKVIGNFSSQCNAVDTMTFSDLDGDGISEIVVGWKTYISGINQLAVYTIQNSKAEQVTSEYTYSNLLTGNFSENAGEEILLLSLSSNDKSAGAALLTLSESKNVVQELGTVPLNPDVVSFSQLITGNIFENQFGAVIDGRNVANEYCTQMLYFNSVYNTLECINFTENVAFNQAYRSYAVLSCDIDNDGIIEIPSAFKLNIEDTRSEVVPLAEIFWCQHTSLGTIHQDRHTATSFKYGFDFLIPESWNGKITAFSDYTANTVTFYEWIQLPVQEMEDDERQTEETDLTPNYAAGNPLLIIKMYPADGQIESGFTELVRNETYIYAFSLPQSNSQMLLTNEEIVNSFSLTNYY